MEDMVSEAFAYSVQFCSHFLLSWTASFSCSSSYFGRSVLLSSFL